MENKITEDFFECSQCGKRITKDEPDLKKPCSCFFNRLKKEIDYAEKTGDMNSYSPTHIMPTWIYREKRDIMNPDHERWSEFCRLLMLEDNCESKDSKKHSMFYQEHNLYNTNKILQEMGFSKPDVQDSLNHLQEHYHDLNTNSRISKYNCDCKIVKDFRG